MKNNNGKGFFFGEKISYPDIAVFSTLDGLIQDFK